MMKRFAALFVYVLLNTLPVIAQYSHVLELFTYDGCGSCILANRKIKRLHDEGYFEKNGILQLSYHVDFESSDGFADSLDSEFNRNRLLTYRNGGLIDGLYTPVLVLDGKIAFAANRILKLDSILSIASLILNPENKIIHITDAVVLDAQINVSSSIDTLIHPLSEVEMIHLLVNKEHRVHLLSGENKGAMRYDVNAVLAAHVQDVLLLQDAYLAMPAPKPFDLKQWAVVALLVHRGTKEIIGFDVFRLQ